MKNYKLQLELVPEPLWQRNLRSNKEGLGPYRWQKLSRAIRGELGKCSICGSTELLHGHENWKYVETPRSAVARLMSVTAICSICHSVQHWGRITRLIDDGIMSVADGRRLVRHFTKVNKCKEADFVRHVARSFKVWRVRSEKQWKIDWGMFQPAILEAKAARELYHSRVAAAPERRKAEAAKREAKAAERKAKAAEREARLKWLNASVLPRSSFV